MICPRCRNNVSGKWCSFCGTKLEDTPYASAPQTPNSPTSPNYPNADNNTFRNERYPADNPVEEAPYYPEDSVNPYSGYYNESDYNSKGKGKLIAVVCICVAAVILVGFLLFNLAFSGNRKNKDPENDIGVTQSDSDNKVKTLTQKAEKCMDRGEYEEAEDLYYELSELTDDKEVQEIYEILYNYNCATDKMNNNDYKSALNFYERIPESYVKYSISSDIDSLYDNIKAAQNASLTLAEIENCIYNEDTEGARRLINTIEREYLTSGEKQRLEDLTEDLEALEEKIRLEKEEEERKIKEEEERKRLEEEERKRLEEENKPSGYGHLKSQDAQNLIYNYCYNLVSAINSYDFGIVSPYIYSGSSLYTKQQALIESCKNQGITETFNYANLNNLTKINDTMWEAKVNEQETIYYANGTSKVKTFNWTYTIEYIDGQFFMTGIK